MRSPAPAPIPDHSAHGARHSTSPTTQNGAMNRSCPLLPGAENSPMRPMNEPNMSGATNASSVMPASSTNTVATARAAPRTPMPNASAATNTARTSQPVPAMDTSRPPSSSSTIRGRRSATISIARPSAMNCEKMDGSSRKNPLDLNSPALPVGICML